MRKKASDILLENGPAEVPDLSQLLEKSGDLWVFAYGSLMWEPGFPHDAVQPALLRGWHRSFCIYSLSYRGTPERPGLVLGLDRGGSCRGLAFRVPRAEAPAALDYLWEREMTDNVYEMRPVSLHMGLEKIGACTFTARRSHADYAGKLDLDTAARHILEGAGARGRCRDYLENTLRHLESLDLADRTLRRLQRRVQELAALRPWEQPGHRHA